MGKKPVAADPSRPLTGKRVVYLDPVANARIEMPDRGFHDFGADFALRLETELYESGRYIPKVPAVVPAPTGALSERSMLSLHVPPDYAWPGSAVPAARLRISVEAMTFQAGSRGERMYYGFDERFRTPFNDGSGRVRNEFPLKDGSSAEASGGASWFDKHFDRRGHAPFDSRSGLDIGDGFRLDALFAWLSVKYAFYRAELHLRVGIEAPLAGINEYRKVTVSGKGYFFDVAGAYEGYSAGIGVARRDAMTRALVNAMRGTYSAIDRAVAPLPLTARVDSVASDGTIALGTGGHAEVLPGTQYELIDHRGTRLEAILSNSSGTLAKLVAGDPSHVQPGALAREALPGLGEPTLGGPGEFAQNRIAGAASLRAARALDAPVAARAQIPAAIESIELDWVNLPKPKLDGLTPGIGRLKALLKSLVETATLPYRIWRYYQYDQSFKGALVSVDEKGEETPVSEASDSGSWARDARKRQWAKQIGLDTAPEMARDRGVTVAVIDSGVDYNHWALRNHLWTNPSPTSLDGISHANRKDLYGWDFVSGDARPYDDGYHGTEVASLVAAVAPRARILPLKVFNPWGVTSSAAIFGAFQYAVENGAQVIVCAWATRVQSEAIRRGVEYARDHGVAVVAAAGDLGVDLARAPAYPASLAYRYDNVLAVAAVDASDRLLHVKRATSNSSPAIVGLAAPGAKIRVATPRSGMTEDSSTSLSAAIAAGALARVLAADLGSARRTPAQWIEELRGGSDFVPALDPVVDGGLRLRVRR
jgi:hypothetical protein